MTNSPWSNTPNDNNNKNFEDLIKAYRNKFKKNFTHPNGPNINNFKYLIILFSVIILTFWLLSGFFILNEGEKAVITRFGKFARTASAGPNYHLPSPFEDITKQKVDRVEKIEIGFRSTSLGSSNRISKNDHINESLMLTGDENILDINFVVQYRISDIKDYVFNVQSPSITVKSAAESAMREVIGSTTMAAALTSGRAAAEQKVGKLIQQILNSYKAGVEVVSLQMLKVDPPEQVIDAFRDVQTSRADKEREINQAQAYYNDVIPRARGEAAKLIESAEGYQLSVVATAEGNVGRFNAIYDQYKNAKEATKKRLYLETMEETLKDITKIIINPKDSNILSYLPLDILTRNKK
jgi:membrane protease subunit HflK